jgi:phosphatidylserine decarboxylase
VADVLAPTQLAKGDEMARFNMGSTVILLFPPGAVTWDEKLKAGNTLRMGERIGTLSGWRSASGNPPASR